MDKVPLSIISLNANGLGENKKRLSVFGWLKRQHNATEKITFLQETHTSEKIEAIWRTEWGNYDIYHSHGGTGGKGVATIIPKTMDYKLKNVIRSQTGRYIALNLTINEENYCLINCYAPTCDKSKEQLLWLKEIQQILQINSEENIVVGGDLNDVFIPQLDRYRCKPNAVETEYVKAWKTICEQLNLTDIWRIVNPEKKAYTWRQGSSATRLKQSRLDYWLVSVHMFYVLEDVSIKTSLRSDHSLIELNLHKNHTPERGPSFWHFNANLLKDVNYVDLIKARIVNALDKYNDIEDKGLKLDLIKMEIRASTICFSKNKAKETRENIKETMIQVDLLEKQTNTEPTDDLLEKYHEGKKQIENYNNEKASGAYLRSRADWAEYGEKIQNSF